MPNLNITYSFPTQEQLDSAVDLLAEGLGYRAQVIDSTTKKPVANPEDKQTFILRRNLENLKALAAQTAARRATLASAKAAQDAAAPITVTHTIS